MNSRANTGTTPRIESDVPTAENTNDTRLAGSLAGSDEPDSESCYFCGAPAEGHAALYSTDAVREHVGSVGQPPARSEPVCRDCGERLNAHRRGDD